MRYKKSDITTGCYVELGNMINYWGRTGSEEKARRLSSYKELRKKPASQRNFTGTELNRMIKTLEEVSMYHKVTSVRGGIKVKGLVSWKNCLIKLKDISDVCKNYKEVMMKGGRR